MGLFSKPKDISPSTPEPPAPIVIGQPVRKDRPTPTRREAEAARMARLKPELDPKKAKAMERDARASQRARQMAAVEGVPERQLVRDVVDSRLNLGEIAMPILLLLVVVSFFPAMLQFSEFVLYAMWGFIILLAVDTFLMWRKVRRLAAAKLPGHSLRGLLFYGWNRQMSFRRWRQPAPRVQRGQNIDDLPLGR